MIYETPGESPQEKRLRFYEEKIAALTEAMAQSDALDKKYKETKRDEAELTVIINGLNALVDALVLQNKDLSSNMPETDEEWDLMMAKMDRIQSINHRVADLYTERDQLLDKQGVLMADFEKIMSEAPVDGNTELGS